MRKAKETKHNWVFQPRFRKRAFGWKSQPAIQRIKEAVSEIKKVARKDPVLGAEGAVLFLERVSPAIEQVDGSSGAIGTAVNRAIETLVPIIATAPAGDALRESWLERLWEAHANDGIPYIESLADYWGELCGSDAIAAQWGENLSGITRQALSPDKSQRGHFHGTSACLSALFQAGRHAEIIDILKHEQFWPYKRWAAKALAAQGRSDEALALAESGVARWGGGQDQAALCEAILIDAGREDAAYERYGLAAHRAGTYLATFRGVMRRYPRKPPADILRDLVDESPGEEGKWFAAAKDVGLFDEALALAEQSPCDPKTLTRAARDHLDTQPEFAAGAACLALHWLVEGYGYEITGLDVHAAYRLAMQAAERLGRADSTRERIHRMVAGERSGDRFVSRVLGRDLGL